MKSKSLRFKKEKYEDHNIHKSVVYFNELSRIEYCIYESSDLIEALVYYGNEYSDSCLNLGHVNDIKTAKKFCRDHYKELCKETYRKMYSILFNDDLSTVRA